MLDGIDGLIDSLRALADRVEHEAAPVAVKAGLDVLKAEIEGRTPVRTGALLAAEVETPVRDRKGYVSGSVAVNSDHAAAVEFGTHHMPAEPFMRPAVRSAAGDAVRAAGDSLDKWFGRQS